MASYTKQLSSFRGNSSIHHRATGSWRHGCALKLGWMRLLETTWNSSNMYRSRMKTLLSLSASGLAVDKAFVKMKFYTSDMHRKQFSMVSPKPKKEHWTVIPSCNVCATNVVYDLSLSHRMLNFPSQHTVFSFPFAAENVFNNRNGGSDRLTIEISLNTSP